MRIRSRVDDDEVDLLGAGGLDPIDQRAFVVALEARQFGARGLRPGYEGLVDLRQRDMALT